MILIFDPIISLYPMHLRVVGSIPTEAFYFFYLFCFFLTMIQVNSDWIGCLAGCGLSVYFIIKLNNKTLTKNTWVLGENI